MVHPIGSRVITRTKVLDVRRRADSEFSDVVIVNRGASGRVTGAPRRGFRTIMFDDGTIVESVMICQLDKPGVLDRIVDAISCD